MGERAGELERCKLFDSDLKQNAGGLLQPETVGMNEFICVAVVGNEYSPSDDGRGE
jgi:hypothetical protein